MSSITRATVSNSVLFHEVAEMVSTGHRVEIVGKGNSMFPLIRGGIDKIVLRKTDNRSIEKGNLLLVKLANDNYVLHRVKKHDTHTVTLQGDGNLRGVETCRREDVIAEAVEVIRGNKRVTKGNFEWKLFHLLSLQPYGIRRVVLAVWRRVCR
ncbi:MAG: hypothetical protein QM305_07510 [Bacteroidota bacterium]|nr:hypothetical protein [Bacteroidota bacterium]